MCILMSTALILLLILKTMILNSPEDVGNSDVPLVGPVPSRYSGTILDEVAPALISKGFWWQAEKDASSTCRVEAASILFLFCLLLSQGSTTGIPFQEHASLGTGSGYLTVSFHFYLSFA